MLTYTIIGPGKSGNWLAGYFKPGGGRVFVAMVDCLTREQASDACQLLQDEAKARHLTVRDDWHRRGIRGFYTDEDAR